MTKDDCVIFFWDISCVLYLNDYNLRYTSIKIAAKKFNYLYVVSNLVIIQIFLSRTWVLKLLPLRLFWIGGMKTT